jgi:hypothetical protein
MTTRPLILAAATSACAHLLMPVIAQALPVPDDTTAPCGSSYDFCLSISNTTTGKSAIRGISDGGYGVAGVSNNMHAVYGLSANQSGVYGQSVNSVGVLGNTNTAGSAYAGVKGINSASNGVGVLGEATFGVFGKGNLTSGTGVMGVGNKGVSGFGEEGSGVYGETVIGKAVHGKNWNTLGWAGYFEGRIFAWELITPSDARLKKDIKDSRYGLEHLLRLRPVTYQWKNGNGRTQLGLIAQEVQNVVPEVVSGDAAATGDASNTLAINHDGLLPILIRAIQEQQTIIQAQQERIARLEKQRPSTWSWFPSGGGALALGLVPIGFVMALRSRKRGTPRD